MTTKFTILGCGSSGGVPRIGGDWGACDRKNPKNRRRRCSLLVERHGDNPQPTRALVDTSPDMREQLLSAGAGWLDGVLFTHEHADHIHGIDDLRVVAINGRSRIEIYGRESTLDVLKNRFAYCFRTPPGSGYPPILNATVIEAGQRIVVDGPGGEIAAMPFLQFHGDIDAFGYRFGGLAYSSDLIDLPPESVDMLRGLDMWIIDALRYTPHPTHLSVEQALSWIDRLKPKRAILTNLHVDLDYETLKSELPDNVEPAYDGLTIEFPG